MTLAIFLTVFLLMIAGGVIVLVRSDRKRRPESGDAIRRALVSSAIPVIVSVNPQRAADIALEALRQVGARDAKMLDPSCAVGWVGNSLTNVPKYSEYQLIVAYVPQVARGLQPELGLP